MKDLAFKNIDALMRLVHGENQAQLKKWGTPGCSPFEWMTYLTEEVGELAQAMSEHFYRGAGTIQPCKEAIQVATLALKIAEMYAYLPDEDIRA